MVLFTQTGSLKMYYSKFIINKYRAIKNIEVSLKDNLVAIIGINESGKTSILQAIFAFNQANDKKSGGVHLFAKNKYDLNSTNHSVAADIKFESENEINEVFDNAGVRSNQKFYKEAMAFFKDSFNNNKAIRITRNLDDKTYFFNDLNIDNKTLRTQLITEILESLPYILYFDDFTDRVPVQITFPANYTEGSYNPNTDKRRNEWHSYIEEIFVRSTQNTLKSFIKTQDADDRAGTLSDVSDELQKNIINDWKNLKILEKDLDKEIGDLELELNYNKNEASGEHIFEFKVKDKKNQGKKRSFPITDRSKGFQWFFNFAIKLKYNHKYVENPKNAIYLLDEPGSYLHSSAQSELLKSLKGISIDNKVIYCTHSQYLLSPETITLNSIRIADRDNKNGVISLIKFGEYDKTKNQGALSPLYDALHLHLGKHDFPKNEKVIITEGITDFYFFDMLNKYTDFLKKTNISIIPGAGATQLKDLISFSIAWANAYTVFLDNDQEGKDAFDRYRSFFKEEESKKWLLYSDTQDNFKLETFLSKIDKDALIKLTSAKNIKNAIIKLYFIEIEKQKGFFEKITDETKNNLSEFCSKVIDKLGL